MYPVMAWKAINVMLSGTRPAEIHDCNMPRLYKSTNIRLNLPSEG